MKIEDARYQIGRLTRKHKTLLYTDAVLWALAVGALAFSVVSVLQSSLLTCLLIAGVFLIVTFITRAYQLHVFSFDEMKLTKLMNLHYKDFQESADLLLHGSDGLSVLQQIQQQRTIHQFSIQYGKLNFPRKILKASAVAAAAVAVAVVVFWYLPERTTVAKRSEVQDTQQEVAVQLPADVKSIQSNIEPPVYTGIKQYTTDKQNVSVPEGSTITWTITFSKKIISSKIQIGTDSMTMVRQADDTYSIRHKVLERFIYQFHWRDDVSRSVSDYFKVDVISDQPPSISVENLKQFTTIDITQESVIDLRSQLADDYALSQAHIVATVAKGSGESVKFREEKLAFATPEKISGKRIQASKTLDLKKLGMTPGDELYFYIEALDNRQPSPNRSRSETFFIQAKDTASQETSVDAGLGVDLMPDYFRSQRQIIIDTEKLLREKKKISIKQFKSTSNELGYDQKVLRLKYGEFLGEEFETNIGPAGGGNEEAMEAADIIKQYGHTHDTENEHNLVEDKKDPAKPEHHDHHQEGSEESPLEQFAHNHDNEETATFFILSVRAKLKAALSQMWDAELYLRINEPQQSLPFQYEALRLLKEISNDSRIYVHRTGFDPPPIKEESRLKGDLNETKSTTDKYQRERENDFPAIRKALGTIEDLLHTNQTLLSARVKSQLQQAGNELSQVALDKPGVYLERLSTIQDLIQEKTPAADIRKNLLSVRQTFWSILPPQSSTPARTESALHALDQQLIENIPHE